jgi:hypothetical protein
MQRVLLNLPKSLAPRARFCVNAHLRSILSVLPGKNSIVDAAYRSPVSNSTCFSRSFSHSTSSKNPHPNAIFSNIKPTVITYRTNRNVCRERNYHTSQLRLAMKSEFENPKETVIMPPKSNTNGKTTFQNIMERSILILAIPLYGFFIAMVLLYMCMGILRVIRALLQICIGFLMFYGDELFKWIGSLFEKKN